MQFDESSDDGIEDNDDDVVPTNTMTISTSSSSYTNPNRDNHAAAATSSLAMSSTSLSTPPQPNQRISETVCTPIGECEQCPSKWNVLIEKEESTIKGEYESCYEYGRRIQFECTVLFQANDSSEKIARNIPEYRSCQFTASDEQFRMFRMQFICLLVGMWSLRNVRKQRVVSASLFDQRRMRSQGNSSVGGSVVHWSSSMPNGNHSSRLRKKPMDSSVELTQQQHHQQNYLGYGKVPKSPAPDFNGQDSDMQTV
ncbi:hypothetical protein ACHAWU_009930 [Discostella pseudostelligera]|uniref:Uncharacterized protein n=1 Tax=Discostella pseudostelligera TaxID=259834 RepID=A0ABD3M1B9_9STRA